MIRYLTNDQIDRKKWDLCIEQAPNGLIYGYTWYLDACGAQWDGLILDDYKAVMPLTSNKKYGIHYLFQPWFCASLGIFSMDHLDEQQINSFIQTIPGKFRYVDISLNYTNRCTLKDAVTTQRTSYLLSLKPSYEQLKQSYRTQLKRNLSKAQASGLLVKWNITMNEIYPLAKEIMQRVSPIQDSEVERMIQLVEAVHKNKQAETIGIYSPANELLASAVFFHSHKRWYYLIVGNHPNGKTLGASHYLIDRFIEKYAQSDELLDFEGSDIRNIAYFYSSFGALAATYQSLKINRLPKLVRWLKK